MDKAKVITIGTEITSGEVVNTNAAWISRQLEKLGVRVESHLSITDRRDAILAALATGPQCRIVIVTGGLGPTSDDITRNCLAEFSGKALEFDQEVFTALEALYKKRGLTLREGHKQQCFFPTGAERLANPVGTALGFTQEISGQTFFVLPGPPRELEGMWAAEVLPRLERLVAKHSHHWSHWTCLGLPESEVAELVEKAVAGSHLEVGYRAAVPYVKVKIFADSRSDSHRRVLSEVDRVLEPALVGRGESDLAEELLELWPLPQLEVWDLATCGQLSSRLFGAETVQLEKRAQFPQLNIHSIQAMTAIPEITGGIQIQRMGEEFLVMMKLPGIVVNERKTLPYKLSLSSERGRKSAAEWTLWTCVKALRAR